MYTPPGYRPQYRRPRPNYAARRVLAATALVVVLWLAFTVVRAIFGSDGDSDLTTSTSTTLPSTTTSTLVTPPACTVGDEPTIYGQPEDWYRTILDPTYAVDALYEPPDLVPASEANYAGEFEIRELIAEDLNGMRNGILEAGVPEVALLATYRSVSEQQALFDRRVTDLGEQAALDGTARAGHSEHHLGTAIDVRPLGQTDVDESFGTTPTGQWLAENSWRYGFILSYPEGKTDLTCYKYEPWHFRYVGVEQARRVHDSGLTLREYLWHWELTGAEPGQPTATVPTTVSDDTTGGD